MSEKLSVTVIDDPTRDTEAAQERTWHWYKTVFCTRGIPDAPAEGYWKTVGFVNAHADIEE